MRTIHCAMCVFTDQVGERKSCNSLTHRACTDLGHDVLRVNHVVCQHFLVATVDFLEVRKVYQPLYSTRGLSLVFLCRFFFF